MHTAIMHQSIDRRIAMWGATHHPVHHWMHYSITKTIEVACFPSDAAVIVEDPVLFFVVTVAVRPVDVTIATLLVLLVQVIVRPVSALPPASNTSAVRTSELFL